MERSTVLSVTSAAQGRLAATSRLKLRESPRFGAGAAQPLILPRVRQVAERPNCEKRGSPRI